MILAELISNCLKHAFPAHVQGVIRIELKTAPDNSIVIVVADDGVGFPPQMNLDQSKTLGLLIVRRLTRQIGGSLEILHPEQGAEIRLILKKNLSINDSV